MYIENSLAESSHCAETKHYTYLTSRQLAECGRYPFTAAALNMLVFRSKTNGLEKAIRRVGRKILISEDLFIAWLESKGKM